MKTKLAAILCIFLFVGSISAAKYPGDVQELAQGSSSGELTNSKLEKSDSSFFDLSFLLSAIEGPTILNPGETGSFDLKLDVLNSFKTSNAATVWTVYECGDNDCRNPPQKDYNNDGKVDSCKIEGDVPEDKDDCVASSTFEIYDITGVVVDGETLKSTVDYTVPENEQTGLYTAEAFIWTSTNGIVSDDPNQNFNVQLKESDGDGVPDRNDECPNTFAETSDGCPNNDQTGSNTDGDALNNENDACPEEFGPVSNNGCPVVSGDDPDGDGVVGSNDECPNNPGLLSNNGCPEKSGIPVLPILAVLLVGSGVLVLVVSRV